MNLMSVNSQWRYENELSKENNNQYIFFKFQTIERDIEKHSSVISSLIALGHNLLNESDIGSRNVDSLSRSVQALEQRWFALKESLIKRKFE